MQSLYRRPLQEGAIAFSSLEGRTLFREALADGTMESFFALVEQFHTQAEPAFCGLGSLVVILNALAIDPGRLWRGPWRWYSEELLDCCAPLDRVRQRGVSLEELACLARCNGATALVVHADRVPLEALRGELEQSCRTPSEPFLIVSYSRRALGQTGDGHFSPIGGYHAARGLVLLLDVARFKYPPHWVKVDDLFLAMQDHDPESGKARGWIVMRRRETPPALLFSLAVDGGLEGLRERMQALRHGFATLTAGPDGPAALGRLLLSVGVTLDAQRAEAAPHARAIDDVRCALRTTETYRALAEVVAPGDVELAAVLALALPPSLTEVLPEPARRLTDLERAAASPLVREEILSLREQFAAVLAEER